MTYKIAKMLIEKKFYTSKEDMQNKLDVFFSVNRLTEEEYVELTSALEV